MKRWIVCAAAALGCGGAEVLPPTGQLVVYIGTDAPLPSAPGNPAPAIPPLFDRIRVSVYAPGAKDPCVGCVGDFSIDTDLEKAGKVSFGAVLADGVAGYVARIDMFRGIAVDGNTPIANSTVTTYVSLPTIHGDGIVPIGVFMKVDAVGKPQGTLAAPVAPLSTQPDFTKVGTWPGAQRVPCTAAGKPGQVCVPGGAFWMGNPQVADLRLGDDDHIPRLVVVSPFFIDSTEVTVASFRAANLATIDGTSKLSTDPVDGNGETNTYLDQAFCTYTTAAGAYESYPVNCLSAAKARAYCAAEGAVLPSEAQHEYVAGNFSSSLYGWGDDLPGCGEVVYGRAGIGAYANRAEDCNPTGRTFGVMPIKSGTRDIITTPTGVIYDIAGNVSEWAQDLWNQTSEPCWSSPLLVDPVCNTPSTIDVPVASTDPPFNSIRGGDWEGTPGELEAAARNYKPTLKSTLLWRTFVGLRCASPGK